MSVAGVDHPAIPIGDGEIAKYFRKARHNCLAPSCLVASLVAQSLSDQEHARSHTAMVDTLVCGVLGIREQQGLIHERQSLSKDALPAPASPIRITGLTFSLPHELPIKTKHSSSFFISDKNFSKRCFDLWGSP
jgi:hypothetical protein